MADETEKTGVSEGETKAEFKVDAFIDAMRETNNEVLQVEELKSHAEKLKESLIGYVTNILKEYSLTLKIPANSLPGVQGVRAVYFDGTGIVSYLFKDGSVKSWTMKELPPKQLLQVFNAAMPHLTNALKLTRKEYEDLGNLLTKIGKHVLSLNEEQKDLPEQHAL